jgi:hypothetical protein
MLGDGKIHFDAAQMLEKIILPIVSAHRELAENKNSSVVVFFNYCSPKQGTWQHLLDSMVTEADSFDLFIFEKPLTLESTPPMVSGFISQWCDSMNFQRHGKEWDVPHAFAKSVSLQSLAEHKPVLCRKGGRTISNFVPYMLTVCDPQLQTAPTRTNVEETEPDGTKSGPDMTTATATDNEHEAEQQMSAPNQTIWDSRERNKAVDKYLAGLFSSAADNTREEERRLYTHMGWHELGKNLNRLSERLAEDAAARLVKPMFDGQTNSSNGKWIQKRWATEKESQKRVWKGTEGKQSGTTPAIAL